MKDEWKEKKLNNSVSLDLSLKGLVQGIGLRPKLYQMAAKLKLNGEIKNTGDKVQVNLEGPKGQLTQFHQNILREIEQRQNLEIHKLSWNKARGSKTLSLEKSVDSSIYNISIPPDQKTCKECIEEFSNKNNRRYLYPFISCGTCGPRYSISYKLPYDRENSTMRNFPLCGECLKEYQSIKSRRFHIQNFCCFECGPKLTLADSSNRPLALHSPEEQIQFIVSQLKKDTIIAMKGIGGYQLVCNAQSPLAIKKLREKKNRPHQALAVMAREEKLLKEENKETKQILQSPSAPIVIVNNHYGLPVEDLAPDSNTLGVFLPTTALHHYLFGANVTSSALEFLVVTSGNIHGSPMCLTEEEAIEKLSPIADFFIHHNRPIARSVDDSVVKKVTEKRFQTWRKARGYTPYVIKTKQSLPPLLALGGDLKNSFCVTLEQSILQSPHMGDLFQTDNYQLFQKTVQDFLDFTRVRPMAIVVDSNPNNISHYFGQTLATAKNIPLIKIQHHLAHAASLLAEHQKEQGIHLTFDGTGAGIDSTIWGGECLWVDLRRPQWERIASLELSALLGGEKAITGPYRQTYARFKEANLPPLKNHPELDILFQSQSLSPKTSSIGRLFDAVSSLLNEQYEFISYEGQAAIALETLAKKGDTTASYPFSFHEIRIQTGQIFTHIIEDISLGVKKEDIALKFHHTVANIGLAMANKARELKKENSVFLSGGVFQNKLLSSLLRTSLENSDFQVFEHENIPPGDGGLSVGQALYGAQLYA
jgi:hydrogenase maturation protein HypF